MNKIKTETRSLLISDAKVEVINNNNLYKFLQFK